MKGVKQLIGRREIVNLPEFGLQHVEVKVDSGAYTSSIHYSHCKEVTREGKRKLEVVFLDKKHPAFNNEKHYFKHYKIKKIKSSNGEEQIRYIINCTIEFMDQHIHTEFSLTQREGMRYPILLGRKFLNKRFIVDTSLVHVAQKTKKIRS